MLIPDFWAEARVQHRESGRQITIRRFGWSNDSHGDAEALARQRAEAALQRALAGEKPRKRERKEPYGGVDGLPIREEVLERIDGAVITRNQYGVQCLNVEDVLFADIDFPEESAGAAGVIALVLLVVGGLLGFQFGGWLTATFAAVVSLIPAGLLSHAVNSWRRKHHESPESGALARIRSFSSTHPDWGLRVYRTPAGYRVIATHKAFDPRSDEVTACFSALRVDPVFARMCKNQNCFRARLTAKPWRIGIEDRIGPRPGIWPVASENIPHRQHWVASYEAKAADFAACRFVEALGTTGMPDSVSKVVELHDDRCRVLSDLPLG